MCKQNKNNINHTISNKNLECGKEKKRSEKITLQDSVRVHRSVEQQKKKVWPEKYLDRKDTSKIVCVISPHASGRYYIMKDFTSRHCVSTTKLREREKKHTHAEEYQSFNKTFSFLTSYY